MLRKYDEYIQNLLIAQYEVSETIEHKLTRGEVREDFLKEVIIKRLPRYRAINGVIVDENGKQSPQCDCILLDANAPTRKIGNQEIVDIRDVLFVIEIKSNATGGDLKKYDKDIARIKGMKHVNDKMKFILFAYKVDLKHKTVLKRFHWEIDNSTGVIYYLKDENGGKEEYSNIDILLSLDRTCDLREKPDESKEFLMRKIDNGKGQLEYFYDKNHPTMAQLFAILS
ncbi:MAG: DUF6602 domain-containing protein [Candidatus Moraniibacteriota bacterium]|jgi:Domain of unknown function (DUF6602)